MQATGLRAEYRVDPLGLDERAPRLSWVVTSDRRGDRQTAYQVRAETPGAGDLWDTGKVPSNRTAHITYEGTALRSGAEVRWSVRVWDSEDEPSPWSEPARFEMGLLDPDDWSAHWIAPPPRLHDAPAPPEGIDIGDWRGNRPVLLRTRFTAGRDVVRARAYVTARGLYRLRLNGEAVGDDRLTPGWTDYRFRIPYQVYDITDAVREGDNMVGAVLADGWYSGRLAWLEKVYGDAPSLRVQIHLDRADGTREVVTTDGGWQVATGEWLWADILMGEAVDLGARKPGWDAPDGPSDSRDGGWHDAVVVDPPAARVIAHRGPPVRVLAELAPVSVDEPEPGTLLVDLGQNMVGWLRIVAGPDAVAAGAGDRVVRVRHAEMLDESGRLYLDNLRGAKATDAYLVPPGGVEIEMEPQFTFHGFRFAEITGLAPGARPSITGVVVGSANPPAGRFECSHPMVNQLQHNIEWGQRGNFLEAPTDCPQRDERLGWMGDAQIFVGTACWNADVAAFFAKWLDDVIDGRSERGAFPDVAPVVNAPLFGDAAPAWGDAGVIVPWRLYERYGDERVLDRCFDAMAGWVDYITEANPDGIWAHRRNNDYGDWLSIEEDTPREVLATAYYFHSADLTARAAAVIGRKEEADRYRALADRVRTAFRRAYVTPDGRVVGHTQTSYVLALAFGLLEPQHEAAAARFLEQRICEPRGLGAKFRPGHLSTGFLGVGHLLPTLTAHGRLGLAYRLLENDEFPSWGYSIKHGATTIWERWDGWTAESGFQTPAMNSFNHYSLGSVGDWLYQVVAGIRPDPDAPGFERFSIAPRPGGSITSARAEHESVRGRIVSEWSVSDGTVRLTATVPTNTSADIHVPGATVATLREGGQPVSGVAGVHVVGDRAGAAVVRVGGGTYRFEAKYEPPTETTDPTNDEE